MATDKAQKINTFIALVVLVVIITVVCVVGSITYGRTNEILQGQAEVTEYRVSTKINIIITHFFLYIHLNIFKLIMAF